jgi:hypothetical protein
MFKWVGDYPATTKPAVICVLGAGMSILRQITDMPGASKVLENFICPYGADSSWEFAARHHGGLQEEAKIVSSKYTKAISLELHDKYHHHPHVVVNGALCTNRWRRGDDQAFICMWDGHDKHSPRTFCMQLQRLAESETEFAEYKPFDILEWREAQEEAVAHFASQTFLGWLNTSPEQVTVDDLNALYGYEHEDIVRSVLEIC